MARSAPDPGWTAAQNRKAYHDYHIEEKIEAGIVLTGTEVKSLREGRASIKESYAREKDGEIVLVNAYIPEYKAASARNHTPRRKRKLLLHKRQISKLIGAVTREGVTLVPLAIYFNDKGIAKLSLGLARGKRKHDKRAAMKERDWKRDRARLLREKG